MINRNKLFLFALILAAFNLRPDITSVVLVQKFKLLCKYFPNIVHTELRLSEKVCEQ
jgi:hypothetical protein